MGTSPVGGQSFYTGSATTSLNFNYYPATAGNVVLLFLMFDAAVTGLSVTGYYGGTTVTQIAQKGNLYCFIATMSSAQYYWMVSWTGSANLGFCVEEYSGATGVSATNKVTDTSTGTSVSESITTDDVGGNYIVGGFGTAAGNSFSAGTGTQRQQNTSNTCRMQIIDNHNSSPGSLTVASTLTSSLWDAIVVELRFLVGAVVNFGVTSDRPGSGGLNVNGKATDGPLANYNATIIRVPYGQTYPRA